MDELSKILKEDIPSIVIGLKLTVIDKIGNYHRVREFKMGDYEKVIQSYKKFKIRGDAKPAKLKKYISISESKGFKIEKKSIRNAGFEGKNKDVQSYNIIFKK